MRRGGHLGQGVPVADVRRGPPPLALAVEDGAHCDDRDDGAGER